MPTQLLPPSIVIVLLAVLFCDARICNVLDYGAVGDGVTNDTKAIQTAINFCNSSNNEMNTILFPPNYTFLSYPFSFTRNNTKLFISSNTTISAAPDPDNWPQVMGKDEIYYIPLISRSNVYSNDSSNFTANLFNITITGNGLINGNGEIWWKPYWHTRRPVLIDLLYIENINISYINLLNSPFYHIQIRYCNQIVVHNINITSPNYEIAPNTDGIDIGSSNAHIYDCYVKNGDDSYSIGSNAVNVTFENSIAVQGNGLESGWNARGGANNCTFRNMRCINTPYGIRLRSLSNMSYVVRDIQFINITFENVTKAFDINQFNQSVDNYKKNNYRFTGFNNLSFINIYGTYTEYVGQLDCSEQIPCHGLLFKNITLITNNNNSKSWECSANVYGTQINVTPPISCLKPDNS
eukprot:42280_1